MNSIPYIHVLSISFSTLIHTQGSYYSGPVSINNGNWIQKRGI